MHGIIKEPCVVVSSIAFSNTYNSVLNTIDDKLLINFVILVLLSAGSVGFSLLQGLLDDSMV